MASSAKVTNNISIQVQTRFQEEASDPNEPYYLFAYRITIENQGPHPVRLLRRTWEIFDANNHHRQVEGAGVVGQQPIIQPGEQFSYQSACNLATELGSMKGQYIMENLITRETFSAEIPEFVLVTPARLN